MASAKNTIGTEIQKYEGSSAYLILTWNEGDWTHWRRIQAETYRIAANVCEASGDDRWCTEVDANPQHEGGKILSTRIKLELAEGDADEMARAEKVLRAIVREIKGTKTTLRTR